MLGEEGTPSMGPPGGYERRAAHERTPEHHRLPAKSLAMSTIWVTGGLGNAPHSVGVVVHAPGLPS